MRTTPREVQDRLFTQEQAAVLTGTLQIVPVDIADDLSPRALAVWLMDDGAADYAGLTIQTHSFTRAETNRLATVLRREYGLSTSVRANRGSWIVYVLAESIPRLRTIVAPYVLADFDYKLIPRRSRTP
jgi:ubiquinol-cytochrome c reductase cytochrome b subunit